MDYLISQFKRKHKVDISQDKRALQRIRRQRAGVSGLGGDAGVILHQPRLGAANTAAAGQPRIRATV